MVDYDLIDPLVIKALHKIGAVDVKTIIECGFQPWTSDKTLVSATSEKRRILLSANFNDINEHKYPPCLHGGIILIKHARPSPEVVYDRIKAFSKSGQRSLAKSHVTHLNASGATIHTLDQNPVKVAFK
jgi:hypothetical protein